MADDQPDAKKPDDYADILTPAMVRAQLDELRSELRRFTIGQVDGLRVQIEALEATGLATRAELDIIHEGFKRLQIEMKSGFEAAQKEQLDTRGEIAGLRSELVSMTRHFPSADQLPSAEIMLEIKTVLEERRDAIQARKETRARIRGGFIGHVFIVMGAVIAEPVKRWVGKYTGWW